MSKKLIGLVMSEDGEGKFWNNSNYSRWITDTLGHPIMIDPFSADINLDLDLLVLPGGSDINPLRYMDFWHPKAGLPNRALEYFDQKVLPHYISANVPILGICRGLQTLNVVFGGTLHPDVAEPTSYNDGDPVHYIKYNNEFLECSSNHHQSIDALGNGFEILMTGCAKTYIDNRPAPDPSAVLSIECIRHTSHRILATQFHPEKNHVGGRCKRLNKEVNRLIKELITI